MHLNKLKPAAKTTTPTIANLNKATNQFGSNRKRFLGSGLAGDFLLAAFLVRFDTAREGLVERGFLDLCLLSAIHAIRYEGLSSLIYKAQYITLKKEIPCQSASKCSFSLSICYTLELLIKFVAPLIKATNKQSLVKKSEQLLGL